MRSCTRHTTRPRRATCMALTRTLTRAHAAAQALVKVAGAIEGDRVRALARGARTRVCERLWRREGGGVLTGRASGVAGAEPSRNACRAQTYFGMDVEDNARWLDENKHNRGELMKVAMVRRRRAPTRARRPCCVPVADAHVTARQRAFNGNKLLTPIFADAFDDIDKVAVAPHPARRY